MSKLAGFGTVALWKEAPDHVQHGLQGDDRGRRGRLLRRVHGGRGLAVHVPQRHRVRHDAQVLEHEILSGIRYEQPKLPCHQQRFSSKLFTEKLNKKVSTAQVPPLLRVHRCLNSQRRRRADSEGRFPRRDRGQSAYRRSSK